MGVYLGAGIHSALVSILADWIDCMVVVKLGQLDILQTSIGCLVHNAKAGGQVQGPDKLRPVGRQFDKY